MATEAQAHQQECIELDSQMERIMKIKKGVESQLIDERKAIIAVEKQIEEWENKHGIFKSPKVDLKQFQEQIENLKVESTKSSDL